MAPKLVGLRRETCASQIPACRNWRCHSSSCNALRIGPGLSGATGGIIVGFAAGGAADIVARLVAQQLSERLGQSFIVENRTGAGTNIGTEAVVRAPPDGYTLLLVTQTNAINATLYASLQFNFVRDILPVARIGRVPLVMEVNPSVSVRTVPEFIAYA
jgi:tripartite-type tricarboxylate transporter receptor subunit TctC